MALWLRPCGCGCVAVALWLCGCGSVAPWLRLCGRGSVDSVAVVSVAVAAALALWLWLCGCGCGSVALWLWLCGSVAAAVVAAVAVAMALAAKPLKYCDSGHCMFYLLFYYQKRSNRLSWTKNLKKPRNPSPRPSKAQELKIICWPYARYKTFPKTHLPPNLKLANKINF